MVGLQYSLARVRLGLSDSEESNSVLDTSLQMEDPYRRGCHSLGGEARSHMGVDPDGIPPVTAWKFTDPDPSHPS